MTSLPRESSVPFPSRKRTVVSCPICEGHRFHYLFSVHEHRLVKCTECNFTLLNPQPSDDELSRKIGAPTRSTGLNADAFLDQLVSCLGGTRGNFLQIGPSDNPTRQAAERRGFEVTVVEFNRAAVAGTTRAENASGEASPWDTIEIPQAGNFDVCVVTEVLQLVRDPRRLLQQLHHALRSGGVLAIVVPLSDPGSALGQRANEFRAESLFYFSRKTLESLLFASGFRALTWASGKAGSDLNVGSPNQLVLIGRAAPLKTRPLLSLIVPVFNEAATFHTAFERLLSHPFPGIDVEFIVVESNSTDGTRPRVQEYSGHPQVRIILEDRPRGKGHAVRTGLRACQGDFVAIQDADLEYDVDDYDALLEPLLANREAFVLGARHGGRSRKMRQFAGQPVTSGMLNFGHWFFTALLNLSLGVRLKDPFTMYKLFRRDCIHDLAFEANRFDFDWELVIKLVRKGYEPLEIPVNYRSRSFHEGKKVRVIRDPLSWLVALAKFRFQRLDRPPTASAGVTGETSKSPR